MAEGVSDDGSTVDVGEGDRGRPPRPPDDPVVAPKGWTYDAKAKTWRQAKRAVRAQDGEDPARGTEPGRPPETDPDPARFSGSSGRDRDRRLPDARPLSDADREEIKSLLALAGVFVLTPLANADPICGQALVDSSTAVFEALVPIIARSGRVSKWMTTAGGFGDWIGLAVALRPVATAVVSHHVFKTVGHDGEEADAEDLARYGA